MGYGLWAKDEGLVYLVWNQRRSPRHVDLFVGVRDINGYLGSGMG